MSQRILTLDVLYPTERPIGKINIAALLKINKKKGVVLPHAHY